MSDFVIMTTKAIQMNESVTDEFGRLCIHPETISKFCYMQDAVMLGALCFIAGIIVMWFFNRLEREWS